MLKRLAVFGLLIPLATVGILAVQDAPKGTPKQGITEPGSGQGGQQQRGTQDNSHPAPHPPTAIVEAYAPVDEAAKTEARENLKIQGELALFTGLLVFVGLLQVGTMIWQARLLKQTREDVHTQAEWMEKQAGYMAREGVSLRRQTTLLRKSADAADISAKAAMGVAIPTLVLVSFDFADMGAASFEAKLQHPEMRVVVKNYGQTPAFLKSYGLKYSCDGTRPTSAVSNPYYFEDGTVVEAGQEYTLQDAVYTPWEPFSVEDVAAIVGKQKILSIAGCLKYGDVFGSDPRELLFCKDLADFRPDGTDPLWVEFDLGEKYRQNTEEQRP